MLEAPVLSLRHKRPKESGADRHVRQSHGLQEDCEQYLNPEYIHVDLSGGCGSGIFSTNEFLSFRGHAAALSAMLLCLKPKFLQSSSPPRTAIFQSYARVFMHLTFTLETRNTHLKAMSLHAFQSLLQNQLVHTSEKQTWAFSQLLGLDAIHASFSHAV